MKTADRGRISERTGRTGGKGCFLQDTVERWSRIIPDGVSPSATLAPPDAGGTEISERLATVVVTRTDSVGAYRILEPIGVGGMGEVRAARQESLKRIVVVKQLRRQNSCDPDSRRRFLAEALVTGELDHPNIVPVYELAKTEAGEPFYAMKLIRGGPGPTSSRGRPPTRIWRP